MIYDCWVIGNKGLPENCVDADDTVRSGGAAVMNDGGGTLHPHPAAVLCEEAVVPACRLTLQQHCG